MSVELAKTKDQLATTVDIIAGLRGSKLRCENHIAAYKYLTEIINIRYTNKEYKKL